jgi:hypothetical protein
MTRPVERLLERLDRVRQSNASGQWSVRCPAHEDRGPSLSIRELDDGRVLIHCFALCGAEDVLSAIGLTFSDLYPEELPARSPSPHGRSRVDYQALLQIAQDELLTARLVLADAVARRAVSVENFTRLERAQERLDALWRHANVA